MKVRVNGRKILVAIALIGASVLMAPSVVAVDEVSESSSPAELRAYIRRVDELIKQNPRADYYNSKGQALELLGDCEDAIAAFTKSLSLSPNDRFARFKRAENFRRLSRFDEAIRDYSDLIDSGHKETFLYSGRSICRSLLQDFNGALADADAAISLNRKSESGWFAKGCAEYNSRTNDFGVESFSEAIRIFPRCRECWAMRSKANLALGKAKESTEDMKQARLLGR